MSSTTSLDFIPAELIIWIGEFMEIESLAAIICTAKRYAQLLTPQLLAQWLQCTPHKYSRADWKHTRHWKSSHIFDYFQKFPSDVSQFYCCTTLLHRFAIGGNLDLVELMLSRGANINARNSLAETPLHCAIDFGHLHIVQALIEAGADGHARDDDNGSPLDAAIAGERSAVVRYLLDSSIYPLEDIRGAFLNAINQYFKSSDIPIMLFHALKNLGYDFSATDASSQNYLNSATSEGHSTLVQLLLANGSDPFQMDGFGDTALDIACSQGNVEIARLLISAMQAAGGNPFIANRRGRTPLIQAIKDSRIDIVNLLLDSGERVAVASDENQIRESALEGSKGVFELLLDREPSLWTSKALESSLLMYTAKLLSCVSNTNNWKAISRILKLVRSGRTKINVSIRKDSPLGPTPLHNVCLDTYHGAWSSGIIRLLLEAGADVDIPDNRGRTPIHNILSTTRDAQDRELILTMIKSSQNIDQLDHEGRSYLHPAAGRNHPRTVQLLLSKMSKDTVFAVMEDGKTALHSAAISGNTSIIQQLLAAGFDVNVKGWKGQTPLHYASQSRNTTSKASCIALLAEAGADMNILDDDGIPPIHDAATSRREDVIEIFLSKGASGHADCEICDQGINATRRWMYCEYYV